ncbi:LysM peptidoglycan-binding domain-containing protein [Bacillus sp. FJAT-47783]|uniref:cell division suppressor protein YneA n=1 Tax=Bacillus sp. FJAT-47783 TaxID=2922712 RepID=UPI001FAE189E|nr:LysM peptidoglycan-binding domain-containing protein [Bacillus sp. FJAT-47783]
MEKTTFTYMISFFVAMSLVVLALIYTGEKEDLSNYHEVTIEHGDSIWSIAERYEEKLEMDKINFVKWVEEKNDLRNLVLQPGDTVVIPVEKKMLYNEHLLAKE